MSALSDSPTCGVCGMPRVHGAKHSCSQHTRRARVRALTVSIKRLSKRELERGRLLYPDLPVPRPESRQDCVQGVNAERPCPFVSCKYHLYLDVSPRSGGIKVNFPHLEVWELAETCALDVADRGGVTLEEVGAIMNLTRERIRQLETRGMARLRGLDQIARAAEETLRVPRGSEIPLPADGCDRAKLADDLDELRAFDRSEVSR